LIEGMLIGLGIVVALAAIPAILSGLLVIIMIPFGVLQLVIDRIEYLVRGIK